MQFRLLILGSNSAIPAFGRNPSAQYLLHGPNAFLIDCGEGTQIRMSQFKAKRGKLRAILISHLHGDHIFGLPGLLTSLSLSGFDQPILIIGPNGISEFVNHAMLMSQSILRFPIEFKEIDEGVHECVYQNETLSIHCFPLDHRIPTFGYLFKEKKKAYRLDGEKLAAFGLSGEQIVQLRKEEKIILSSGQTIFLDEVALPPNESYSYAYCSDTRYSESILPYIEKVDLLYHESTFTRDMAELAKERYHSTAEEAAQMAKKAKVNKLLLGHFSSRFADLNVFKTEAEEIFLESHLAIEGKWYDIP
jgi:ribonuclease Z